MARSRSRPRYGPSLGPAAIGLGAAGALGVALLATKAQHPGGGGAALPPRIFGTLSRNGSPAPILRPALAGYDVQGSTGVGMVPWSDLQANAFGPLLDGNPFDTALADLRQYNALNPQRPQVGKLRVGAGRHAPADALGLAGPPVQVTDTSSGITALVPRFWVPGSDYDAAFYDLEAKLQARYDGVPEFPEIVICKNMTIYPEPLIHQLGDAATRAALVAAGYTTDLDEQNQMSDLAARAIWKKTVVGYAFNPYETVDVTTLATSIDMGFLLALMQYGRQVLGGQLSIENNSIRQSFLPGNAGNYPIMYGYFEQVGGPIAFQTSTAARVGDLLTTLQGAAALGADHVELPSGWETLITPEIAAAWPNV